MTILFKKDWYNEQGKLRAIPHASTKNVSFLRTCAVFKNMKLANYAFPLALYDPDLADIDPFDLEDNTPENERLRTKVQVEAARNGWYYLRECVRIYEQGGKPVRFRLDRGSAAMAWTFFNGIDYASTQPRQTGKAQPLYCNIRTPDGWKAMGDIALGDKVLAPDGGVANVIGVYPQGKRDIYRIHFQDGRYTDCCEEHLWKIYNKNWCPDTTQWRVISTKDVISRLTNHPNTETPLSVPLVKPEQNADIDLPFDPYVIGAILGDGNVTTEVVRFSTADDFIVHEMSRLLPSNIEMKYVDRCDYRFVDNNRSATKGRSSLITTLRELDVFGKYSYTKTIPEQYLKGSLSQKLSLLQGLMDTDGTVCTSGSISYCTTSETLAIQVRDLIRSIGGLCKIHIKHPYYTHQNVKLPGRPAFVLSIRVNDQKSLFRLPRKIDRLSKNYKFAGRLKLNIVSIKHIGKEEAQCIEVDHPDHLYITDDYIVTHNTVGALSLTSWILYSSGEEFTLGMFCKDNKLRQENVKRVRTLGESLPKWWIAEDKFKDKKNTEELLYAALKTHYVTMVAQKDKSAADLQARGASMPMIHIDEFEYCANIAITYSVMLSSTDAARANAKKNGKPHSNIITTTAGDPSKQECRDAAKILEGAMPFTEFLYDTENRTKLHELVEASSPQKMILGVFSHNQLGYDNNWLRDKINRNKLTREQVCRDYLNRRVSIADEPVIPPATLALINASQREHNHIQILSNKFVIYWYVDREIVSSPEFKNRPIVVGCDSSEMIGRDATTLVGVDPRTLETVFTFRASEGNLNVVGVMIAQLMLMFPKMVLVPENKSSGTSFIDNISLILRREGHNPFTRMFNWVVNNRHEKEFESINIRDMSLMDTKIKRFFGIKTDANKRDELYGSTLLEGARRAATKIKDRTLIQELGALTVRNGRVDHTTGGHDDVVVAWLLSMWFILNGKHLDVYGIAPGTIMSVSDPGKPDQTRLDEERQQMVRTKIEHLEKMLKQHHDPSLRKSIEADLTVMRQWVDTGPVALPVTADDLNRDPKRFTDATIAKESRTPVNMEDIERSLKTLLDL